MSNHRPLDRIDINILDALQNDGRLSNKELAAHVGLAPSSCLERVRRLRERGVLRGVHADIDPDQLGVGLRAMISIQMRDQTRPKIERFVDEVVSMPEVAALFNLAGEVDCLLHVFVRDTQHLRDFVLEAIAARPEVRAYTTNLIFSHIRGWQVPCYLEDL